MIIGRRDSQVLTRLYFDNRSSRVKDKCAIPNANIKPTVEGSNYLPTRPARPTGEGRGEGPRESTVANLSERSSEDG
jgi:hypothetical protein